MKKFLLSLEEKTHQELKVAAITQGISMNELILEAIKEKIRKEK